MNPAATTATTARKRSDDSVTQPFRIAMKASKAVPILLRGTGTATQLLVFRHPLAGVQLVKGSIEAGESIEHAAVRELEEESGIQNASVARDLGVWSSGYEGQVWHFCEVQYTGPVPEEWEHFTQDGGGRLFQFFWHPLYATPSQEWHPVYQAALIELRSRLLRFS